MTVMIESNAARRPAENGATQAKDTYEKATAATQDLPKHFQDASSKLAQGAQNYTGRLIELARTNTNAAFDYAQALLGVKSPAEFAALSTEYTKAQFAAFNEQAKELGVIAQKVCAEAAEPIKTGVGKVFSPTR